MAKSETTKSPPHIMEFIDFGPLIFEEKKPLVSGCPFAFFGTSSNVKKRHPRRDFNHIIIETNEIGP